MSSDSSIQVRAGGNLHAGQLIQGRQFGDDSVRFRTGSGARVSARADNPRVEVLSDCAIPRATVLLDRYCLATRPIAGCRRNATPLSAKETHTLGQLACVAYNAAMRGGRYGVALSIAARLLRPLSSIPGTGIDRAFVERRYDDSFAAHIAALKERLAASTDADEREFLTFFIRHITM